ncbi:Hypothetical protein MOVI_1240 [Mesomycoplasma ovipneumoniae 14811]|uniref:Uncharacterized protein n=1 Tax=Mesomycoplasma ovipneumoniae 14811 TaxID=1188239 RepID=A0A014NR49_9BACT|nr:Hypothetical protein MOVI_1240 [Mesomycoplasma ovipneumoniae 14811]
MSSVSNFTLEPNNFLTTGNLKFNVNNFKFNLNNQKEFEFNSKITNLQAQNYELYW